MRCAVTLFLIFFSLSLFAAGTKFYCPMKCEGEKTYEKRGTCPVCGMKLEPTGSGPKQQINSLDYRADLKLTPEKPASNIPVELRITIRNTKDNSPVNDFEIVHEKLMHLVVVSQELDLFSHIHPEKQSDGSFVVKHTFFRGGNFVAYVDVTPKGQEQQIFPLAIQVQGPRPAKIPSIAGKAMTAIRQIGDYQARLNIETPPVANLPLTLKFTVKYKDEDVTDLQPYLGAAAHLFVIHEDNTQFVHVHPIDHDHVAEHLHHPKKNHPKQPQKLGPEVRFIASFPKSGTYKAWIQFQHKGKVQTINYIIHVKD